MTVLAFSFGLLLAGAPFAGEMTKAAEGGKQEVQATTYGEFLSVDKLTGMKVRNQAGKSIGEVAAVQVDDEGSIRFLAISTGGVLGIGAKERLVPYSAFRSTEAADALILTVDESLLASSPQRAPGMTEDAFSREIYEHYGQAPYWEAESGAIPEAAPEN
jgi:sporulation protein YlmC with PRC-barrel domain